MMANGIKIKLMEKENFGIKMEISMRDIGKMERPKVMDFTKLKVVVVTLETGIMIYSTVMEKRLGQMGHFTKENITKALNREKVSINTWMVLSMKAIGFKIKYKVSVHILGLMVKFLLVNGKIITCMVKASLAGQMEDNTKVNIATIKKKGLEFILGPMVDNTQDNGKMASNMVKAYIRMLII